MAAAAERRLRSLGAHFGVAPRPAAAALTAAPQYEYRVLICGFCQEVNHIMTFPAECA